MSNIKTLKVEHIDCLSECPDKSITFNFNSNSQAINYVKDWFKKCGYSFEKQNPLIWFENNGETIKQLDNFEFTYVCKESITLLLVHTENKEIRKSFTCANMEQLAYMVDEWLVEKYGSIHAQDDFDYIYT